MNMRKQQSTNSRNLTELSVSKEEAELKLRERIDKGKEIVEVPINSANDFDKVKEQYYTWDDFNKELLKRLFSTDELVEKYSGGFSVFVLETKPLQEEILDFRKDVKSNIRKIKSIIEKLELFSLSETIEQQKLNENNAEQKIDKKKVFIVHGHDDSAKYEVARFLEKLDLEPIILHEQASESKTIIEKIEAYSDVGFGVVIYTPCDTGAKNTEKPELKGRARQNVVFEHGFLIGKLDRKNVCPLVKGDVELPNDISGVVYISKDSDGWKVSLAKELKAAGYEIDMNKII